MISFKDILKGNFLAEFSAISVGGMLGAIALAFVLSLFIVYIYRITYSGVSYSRNFAGCMIMIAMVTALVIQVITSNVVLSLGMVGALSIVRFRTAIKDATDTAFLFWCVAAGITAGAGFYMITLIGCLFIGVICIVCTSVLDGTAKTYLLVVRMTETEVSDKVENIFDKYKMNYKLSTLTQNGDYAEAIYELAFAKKYKGVMSGIKSTQGVLTLSLVDCRKS